MLKDIILGATVWEDVSIEVTTVTGGHSKNPNCWEKMLELVGRQMRTSDADCNIRKQSNTFAGRANHVPWIRERPPI